MEEVKSLSLDDSLNENSSDGYGSFLANIFWMIDLIGLFVVVVVLMQTFVYRTMHVKGDSMLDTFQSKDSVVVSNLFYEPKRFDIVIINTKDAIGRTIIKRIIALPGDTVRVENGDVYVNDVKLNEPYLKRGIKTFRKNFPEGIVTVPKGCFFALGDNRPCSSDSREWGFFRNDQILGKVRFRLWPLNKMKLF